MIRRRTTATFSLSFLDCICCGFGAIILIFVLTIGAREKEKIHVLEELQQALAAQLGDLAQLQIKQADLDRSHTRVNTLVTEARVRREALKALLADLEAKLQKEKSGQEALLVDLDALKKEIAARQKKPDLEVVLKNVDPAPLGLPTHHNYVAIVIDTSGSMRDPNHGGLWPIAIRKIDELLDAYPTLKGIQLLDGDGRFIMGRRGQGVDGWLTDSPELRDQIKRVLRRYDQDSISNPVPGIRNALRFLFDKENPDMKMAIFVFGDEFTDTADPVIKHLDELNPADENGNRKVVINAVLFPTTIRYTFSMGNTGVKLSNLMREVCYQHGGAFIALQDL